MVDVQEQVEPVAGERAGDVEPAWSALRAFWAAWLMPATAGRRTAGLPLWRAWCVHLVAVLLIVELIAFLVTWAWKRELGPTFHEWVGLPGELIARFDRYPVEITVAIAGIFLAVEAGFLALAGGVMAWGARDETLGRSYVHALRQTWLHTTHALPAILLIGSMAVSFELWEKDWNQAHPFDPPQIAWPSSLPAGPTPPPPNVPRNSKAWKDYWAARRQHQKQIQAMYRDSRREWQVVWAEQRASKPWALRHQELIDLPVFCLAPAWVIWALLRRVDARRGVRPTPRPPMCETCGYNLLVTPMDSRCPECGVPVMESLGPQVRAGPAWERRAEVGRVRAWWRCCVDAMLRPRRFGRQVLVSPASDSWKRLLLVNMVGLFLLETVLVFVGPIMASSWEEWAWDGVSAAVARAVVAGFYIALCALLLTTAAAGLVGLVARPLYGRNLLAAAIQNAAYLSGYVLLATLVLMALGIGLMVLERELLLEELIGQMGMWGIFLGPLALAMVTIGLGLLYLILILRATASARYANR